MRISVAVAVACLSAMGISTAQDAQAAIKKDTTIPAQGLGSALQQLANDRDVQLVYRSELVGDKQTYGAAGDLTFDEALTKLLAGTGLTYQYIDEQAITIVPFGNAASPSMPANSLATVEKQGLWQRFRVAQAATPAAAEQSETSTGGGGNLDSQGRVTLEEVIVTAQKREERLQDVPISMSVLSGATLDKSTAGGVAEALSRVPGVAISEGFQTGGSSISVRGVAAANVFALGSSPIAYYLDSVPFGFVKSALTPDTSAYDLDRVEVLRGPQGTLYGASAQNGVVRVLTKDANLDAMEFKGRTSASSTHDGGENYRGDMALNVPIIAGKLAARAVAGYQDNSGWIDKPNGEDVNDGELMNLRLKVNAQPTEQLSVGLSSWLSRNEFGAPTNANNNRQHSSPADEPMQTDYDAFGLKIAYDFVGFTVTSSTSYLDYTLESELDTSFAATNILTTNLKARVFAEEIYLNSTHDGVWRWSLGGMYRDAQDELYQLRHTPTGAFTGGYLAPGQSKNLSESYAVFGELTRLFADGRLELTAGLRYFEDDVGQQQISANSVVGGIPPQGLFRNELTFDAVSPRVVLTWHPSEQITAYTSYSEGFRSGSDQGSSVRLAAPSLPATEPDELKNYEAGLKGNLFDGRLAFDTAVYFMDWQDVQQPITVVSGGNNFSAIINGQSASGLGVDVGLTLRATDSLTVDLAYSTNDLEQDTDVISGGIQLFDKGDRLNLSPARTIGGSAQYTFPVGGGGLLGGIEASANYTSARDSRGLVGGRLVLGEGDSLLMAAMRFSVESPSGWTLSAFADNLTDENGAVVRSAFFLRPDTEARIRPRTVGMQLEYRFK